MLIEKQSCWSLIVIDTKDNNLSSQTLDKIEKTLYDFEQKYSRFIPWNFLHVLNHTWKSKLDEEFKTLFRVCDLLNKQTNWFFDITVLPFLENNGYGIEKDKLVESYWMDKIEIIWDEIILKNDVKIDFWAIWKGYLVDSIYAILSKEISDFSINFGWDIKIWNQREKVWLEDPYDDKKLIGEIYLSWCSLASSSAQKRQFWTYNHLVNPISKDTKSDKIAIYIKHKLAIFADAYSTALFVTPLEKALEILEKTSELEALIIAKNGEIYKTSWFDAEIY
jgi:thiamine biosynthesis lipoprotein ApbE